MNFSPRNVVMGLILTATAFVPAWGNEVSWPNLSRPAPAIKSADNDVAIIASVERYAFISPIPGASDNANGWYDYFTKTLGMPPERVLLLKNGDVTREELLSSLEKSAANAPKGGALWFVFIGHGAPGPKGEEGFLVGVDAQQKALSLYSRSISEKELRHALNKAPSARINVILDACFSGRDSSGNALVGGLQPLLLHNTSSVADPRWMILTAAHADQFAGPLPGAMRPAFSYLALGALRGWAHPGKAVTAGEILGYTKRVLGLLVRDRQQEPTLEGDPNATLAPFAEETGPDLTELQKSIAGGETEFRFEPLPSVIVPRSPQSLDKPTIGLDWRKLDVASLEAYNKVAAFEKRPVSGIEKAAKWKEFGKHFPAHAKLSAERAQNWQRYAAQVARAQHAATETAKARRRDWDKLSRLLKLDIVTPQQKVEWITSFEENYSALGLPNDLAALFSQRVIVKDDFSQDEAACAAGETKRCLKVGSLILFGAYSDKPRAAKYLTKACDADLASGCRKLGMAYYYGGAIEKDFTRSVVLLQKACALDDGEGCAFLGGAYKNGDGVAKDNTKAVELFNKSCDMGDALGCRMLGNALDSGEGADRNPARAAELYRKACDWGDGTSCFALGAEYQDGRGGVSKNLAKAVELYREACDVMGDGGGCLNLGMMYYAGQGVGKDQVKAVELFRKSCEEGTALGCLNVGIAYDTGEGLSKDIATAFDFYRKACDKGDGSGCFNLALGHDSGNEVSKDLAMATDLFGKSCALNVGVGCLKLGIAYQMGRGISPDPQKSTEIYSKACDLGNAAGCAMLGESYGIGRGVSKDPVMANKYLATACREGFSRACSKTY